MVCLKNAKKTRERTNGQSFVQGALILTLGMAIVKIVGALFKVPLNTVIGEYGMGLFNVAYNFYGPVHSLATAGLPIAISRMVSECFSMGRYREIRKIKRVSTPIFLTLGLLGTALMLFGAPYYCREIINNNRAVLPMLTLAPAVLFGCLGSIYRGYFEGLKNMYPTAVSEVIESMSKLIVGLSASVIVVWKLNEEFNFYGTILGRLVPSADEAALMTLSYAAAAAIFGVTLGSLISFMFLLLRYHKGGDGITLQMLQGAPRPRRGKTIAKILIRTAIPVAIGSVTVNIAGLIDTTFLQQRLAYIIQNESQKLLDRYQGLIPDMYLRQPDTIPNLLFGCYSMALTVYMIVPTITQAFSISALPSITQLWIKGNREKLKAGVEMVLRLTALFSLPAGIGISAIAGQISKLLYGDDVTTPIVAGILTLLGMAAALAAISTPISSMLQAVGRADIPVKLLIIAMLIKVGVNYVLCGNAEINVYGAAIGTLCCYLFLVISQVILLCRVTRIRLSIKSVFLKPFVAAVLCGVSAHVTAMAMEGLISLGGRMEALITTVAAIGIGMIVYAISLWAVGGLKKSDLDLLPKGQKIAKILEKHK